MIMNMAAQIIAAATENTIRAGFMQASPNIRNCLRSSFDGADPDDLSSRLFLEDRTGGAKDKPNFEPIGVVRINNLNSSVILVYKSALFAMMKRLT